MVLHKLKGHVIFLFQSIERMVINCFLSLYYVLALQLLFDEWLLFTDHRRVKHHTFNSYGPQTDRS